jgi:hypothetical protein
LNLEGSPDEKGNQRAQVRFLSNVEEVPTQWLRPHSRFALFEGQKKVAEGTVLS